MMMPVMMVATMGLSVLGLTRACRQRQAASALAVCEVPCYYCCCSMRVLSRTSHVVIR
jgi:hypothetical protein